MKKIIIILSVLILSIALSKLNYPAYSAQGPSAQEKFYEKVNSEREKIEAKVKEFEPTTPLGKFMGVGVSSFLIVSIVILIVGGMLASGVGDEFWLKIIKYYTGITVYFLVNYLVWLGLKMAKFKYVDIAVLAFLCLSAAFIIYIPLSIHRESMRERGKYQIPTWLCPKCSVENHYNDRCWNCKTEKQGVDSVGS